MVWVMTTRGRALSEAFNTGPANKALRANRWRPGSCFLNLWSKFWGFEALRAMADAAYLYFFEGVVRVRFSLLSSTFCFVSGEFSWWSAVGDSYFEAHCFVHMFFVLLYLSCSVTDVWPLYEEMFQSFSKRFTFTFSRSWETVYHCVISIVFPC